MLNDATKAGKIKSTSTQCTVALGSDRHFPQIDHETGAPINPSVNWWSIKITTEMQAAADKIYANSAARQPMRSR